MESFDPFPDGGEPQAAKEEGGESSANLPPSLVSSGSANDSFDPFGITELAQTVAAEVEKVSASPVIKAEPFRHASSNASSVGIVPKLMTKLTLYEEVSSSVETDGSSDVQIEGSIYAQVQCSDAKRNAPFMIKPKQEHVHVRCNPKYGQDKDGGCGVAIPKQELGHVPVAYYSLKEKVIHMPVLLERKVTVQGTLCRIAVQLRTKLTNRADLQDASICVAVPERVDGDSVEIVRGDNGQWDELKRTIVWKMESLVKGESVMVSAQANLWKEAVEGDDIRFPVLLRCSSSADQISSADFDVSEIEESPARLNVSKVTSFRLLHRLT